MRSQHVGRQAVLLAAVLLSTAAARAAEWEPPATLGDTGLYADRAAKTVSPAVLAFTPQYPLWTDGAAKSRFILLPAGTWIDASNPDEWQFPVGTKLWKEFRFGGRPLETRYIERAADGWHYAAYAWNEDEQEALLAPERGMASREIQAGVRHAIPGRYDCRACHEGRTTPVLGFTALQLSPDRDPNALHGEPLRPGDLDLRALVARGLVRNLPAAVLRTAPRIAARSAAERSALGYLYANCAMCHNGNGPLAPLGLSFDHTADGRNAALATTVRQPSRFTVPGENPGASERLRPGDPDRSTVAVRLASRSAAVQMPPLGTQLVDEEAVRLVRRWIAAELDRPHSDPVPRKENDR